MVEKTKTPRKRETIETRTTKFVHTDLTFITNENNRNLLERFKVLIKDTKFFDVLVGYFYTSGFHALYKSLESTEKIRILIGISTNRQTFDLIQQSKTPTLALSAAHSYYHRYVSSHPLFSAR